MFFSTLLWMAAEETVTEDVQLQGHFVVTTADQGEVTPLTLWPFQRSARKRPMG